MNKPSTIIKLIMAVLIILASVQTSYCQDEMDLLNQLIGNTEAPERNAQEYEEAYQKVIDYLFPYMTDENIRNRYQPQIAFQNLGSYASRPGAEVQRHAFVKVVLNYLQEKEMDNTVRNWFVLQIQRTGKGDAVPYLTKLLSSEDKILRDYARKALEWNPDPSAEKALLAELTSAKESVWKVGLINSLGQKKSESAVPVIISALGDSDLKVAETAAFALANISSQPAIDALINITKKPDSPIYVKAAQGLVDAAQAKAIKKETAAAGDIFAAIYENTSKNTDPMITSVKIAAINGTINCNPEKGAAEIVNFVKDENPKIRLAAVTGARTSTSDAPAQALSKSLADLKPDTQIQVLGLIGERKDLSSIDAVKKMLDSDNQQVRLASIDTMSKLGDAIAAQSLFDIAANGIGNEKQAAHQGLVQMSGTNVQVIINANLSSQNVPGRVEAIKLAGERHMTDAVNSLLIIAAEDNEQISSAAFAALSEVAGSSSVPTLIRLISQAKSDAAREEGINTLKSILANAEDKEAAAQVVIDQIGKTSGQVKISLITSLSALGGSKALATVTEAAKSSDEETRDQAIRTLCNWPDYEGTKNLFDIASNSETALNHHVLAIRGILRLIEENDSVPVEERAALCLSTYDIARRDEEKMQVLSTLGTLPCEAAIAKLLDIASGDTMKSEAALAAVQLASSMSRSNREAAQELAQKIIDMNISEDINAQAQMVISGRGRGFGGAGGMNFGNRGGARGGTQTRQRQQ